LLLEKESSFGQGISSRNSEVVHAGIYYPKGSLKASLCVEGRRLLYDFLANHSVPHRVCGKYIVAVEDSERVHLEILKKAIDETQKDVTGTVRLKLYKGNCSVAGRRSERSLYHPELATFEAENIYNQKDAEAS
jgi:glycerol-3-phosphate dehydrogenase